MTCGREVRFIWTDSRLRRAGAMSDNAKPPRRRVWKYVLFLVIAGLLALAALAWYTTTDSFQDTIDRRVVSEIERSTGGRAERGALSKTPLHLQAESV